MISKIVIALPQDRKSTPQWRENTCILSVERKFLGLFLTLGAELHVEFETCLIPYRLLRVRNFSAFSVQVCWSGRARGVVRCFEKGGNDATKMETRENGRRPSSWRQRPNVLALDAEGWARTPPWKLEARYLQLPELLACLPRSLLPCRTA